MTHKSILFPLLEGMLSVTQAAAIACYDWVGKEDGTAADGAAVAAMRDALNKLPISGRIVIGEGERDEAPMLYIGEKVGQGGVKVDIAVDPLEGTALCAEGRPNSISVLAVAPRDTLLHAPDVYMEKIAVGSGLPDNILDLDATPTANLQRLANAKQCKISELTACVLKRDRHTSLIAQVKEAGARVHLIDDGDVMAALATALPNSGIDVYFGTGGAPEGVLAAAALKCVGGQMLGRLVFKNKEEEARAKSMGCTIGKIYSINDMVASDVLFIATGVTTGEYLKGVQRHNNHADTNSVIATNYSAALQFISNKTAAGQ